MAAIKRALIPQLSTLLFHNLTRSAWESSRKTLSARYASRISSLQPAFPSTQDRQLFEDVNNEYATVDTPLRQLPKTTVKSNPCDALASAALEDNEPLANALLTEYRQAGIDILFRPEYEDLANHKLRELNFEAFFVWLDLLPPVGGEQGILFPKNTHMVEQMSRIRLPFDQMYRLMYLFGRKGWSGPVPNELVSTLARYTDSGEFTRLLAEVLDAHKRAHGSSEEVRWIHAEWRNRAIQEFATRNDPETAFAILEQSPWDVIEFDPKVLKHLDHSASRMQYPIPIFVEEWIKTSRAQAPPETISLRNSDVATRAYRLLSQRTDTMTPATSAKSIRKTAVLMGSLKQLLIDPSQNVSTIDPRPVAFLFYVLAHSNSQSRSRLLNLFRKRVARLGTDAAKTLWATVEVELLIYLGDAHAAVLYYHQTFLPLDVPFFLDSFTNPTLTDHWKKWMEKKPLLPLPPAPSETLLRPSAVGIMSIWKAAIILAIRDPDSRTDQPTKHGLHGAHAHLTKVDESGATIYDPSHLTDLFRSFLSLFDSQMIKRRTLFSNPFTRVRYFELFLRRYVHVAPSFCASVMAQIQARDVPLDHRVWAVYAKSKIDTGDPEFVLRIFEMLQHEIGTPLDFSPQALKDWKTLGMRGVDDGHHLFTIPSKVLSAYVYAFRQLIKVGALPEALELHARILEAGYREGTSLSLDRLIYRLLEELRLAMREPRIRLNRSDAKVTDPAQMAEVEELEEDFGPDDIIG